MFYMLESSSETPPSAPTLPYSISRIVTAIQPRNLTTLPEFTRLWIPPCRLIMEPDHERGHMNTPLNDFLVPCNQPEKVSMAVETSPVQVSEPLLVPTAPPPTPMQMGNETHFRASQLPQMFNGAVQGYFTDRKIFGKP